MRLWILFGCGVLILGAAIWPFGRKTEQLAPAPVPPTVTVKPPTPEPPKPEPAKIVEVIDLARAYEPIREPEEPAGTVDPAAFIEVPEQPKPIPPAVDLDNPFRDLVEFVRETASGDFLFGAGCPLIERLDVMPREVK
jgi:hypothetical protein